MASKSSFPSRYRFGEYDLDLAGCCLRRHGIRIKLQPLPFQLLVALLERPEELVSREELQKRLWPAGTYVDFDQGLNVAIKKLRDALCDSADEPRYIETLLGHGYRWIAEVHAGGTDVLAPIEAVDAAASASLAERLHVASAVNASNTSISVSMESHIAGSPQQNVLVTEAIKSGPVHIAGKINWESLIWSCMAVLLLLGVALGWWLWVRNKPNINFAKRDYVLVGEFENRTGEAVFESTCQFALASELSASRFVNVVPPQRVHDVLRLMKQPSSTQLNPEIAREVCLRDGEIRAYLTGRIEKFGDRYRLTSVLVEPKSNAIVGSWSEPMAGISDFPRATHRLAATLRAHLGEPLADIQLNRLPKVTTKSLESLRLYSQVDSQTDFFPDNSSVRLDLLQRAVDLDPDFAMAQIWLADNLYRDHRVEESRPHFRKALELSPTLTDYERLFILGSYYQFYSGDLPKAIAAYTQLVLLYPDDFWAVDNLFDLTGRSDLAYRAADIRPGSLRANMFAVEKAMEANDPVEQRFYQRASKLLTPEVLEANSDCVAMKLEPAYRELANNHLDTAQAEAQKLSREFSSLGPRARDSLAFFLGAFYAYIGQLHTAEYWYNQMSSEQRALGLAQLADARHQPGDAQRWSGAIASMEPPNEDPNTDYRLAYFGTLKQIGAAPGFADWNHRSDRILQAEAELVQKHRKKAIQLLREELANSVLPDERVVATALLARILENSGDSNAALEVLQALSPNSSWPGLNVSVWPIELRFHLAQLYRARGANAEALKVESELRNILADADSDHWIAQKLRVSTLTAAHR